MKPGAVWKISVLLNLAVNLKLLSKIKLIKKYHQQPPPLPISAPASRCCFLQLTPGMHSLERMKKETEFASHVIPFPPARLSEEKVNVTAQRFKHPYLVAQLDACMSLELILDSCLGQGGEY